MSRIKFNTNNDALTGRTTIGDLKAGETFRFRFGRNDHVYIKLSDDRFDSMYCDRLLASDDWRSGTGDVYASLGSGQVYRASAGRNADVVRVNVNASVDA